MAHLILWNCLNVNHAPIRPIGPHRLSQWLRSAGYDVKVIDFCHLMKTEQLVNLTRKYIDNHTIGIGVSSTFWRSNEERFIDMEIINQKNSEVRDGRVFEPQWVIDARKSLELENLKWLLGGSMSTYPPQLFKFPWISFQSYGEDALLKFMDEHSNVNSVRPLFDIVDLRHGFTEIDFIMPQEVLPIETSRGCQFKCGFCRFPLLGKKKGTYIRKFESIEDEFLYNYDQFGTTKYFFLDDTANESEEKIEELSKISQRLPFKLEWIGYNRLDLIGTRRHTIDTLAMSGLKSSFFGMESFHPEASKVVGKGWNGVHGKEFLQELIQKWDDNISVHLHFIIGLKGEIEDSIEDSFKWCVDNNISSWKFNPLSLRRNQDYAYPSEFDKNYGIYGYKFPTDDDDYWENKEWNFRTALEKSRELNIRSNQYTRISSWLLGELSTHGESMDNLMRTPTKTIQWKNLYEKSIDFVNAYYNKQINI